MNSGTRPEQAGELIPELGPDSTWRSAAGFTRRDFVQLVTGAALMTGLFFTHLIARAGFSGATDLTPSTYGSICYKPANANGTRCCSCGSSVSSAYCGGDGWHRHHTQFFTGVTIYNRLRTTSCDNANAWRWQGYGNGNWRCSDGQVRNCYSGGSCSSWANTVCPATI